MTHGTGWELFALPDGASRLCHGDVGEVAAAAQALGELASGGSEVAAGVNGLGVRTGTSGWEGTGADAFLSAWRTLVPPTVGLAETAEMVSGAVSGWADQLAGLQQRADALRDAAEQAHDELHAAEDAHDRALAHHASFGDRLADLWDRLAL